MTLPNVLVIGAQRAGTTLLHHILDHHPDVYMPQRRKEIHYFDWYFERGPEWYSGFFPDRHKARQYRAIGEATPDYLFDARVPGRIRALLPKCRFVVSLRNPIDRAFSWYLFCLRSVNERRSQEEFFCRESECLRRGLYSEQLMRYFRLFPRSDFMVLIYEELIRDPVPQLEALADFLDLSCGWKDPEGLFVRRVNASEIPRFRTAFARAQRFGELLTRHDLDWLVRLARRCGVLKMFGTSGFRPPLSESTRNWLADFYEKEVAKLELLLGRDLNRLWLAAARSSAAEATSGLSGNEAVLELGSTAPTVGTLRPDLPQL